MSKSYVKYYFYIRNALYTNIDNVCKLVKKINNSYYDKDNGIKPKLDKFELTR